LREQCVSSLARHDRRGCAAAVTDSLELQFLRDVRHGGDPGQPRAVAAALARFVDGARSSVDVAIYDFRLTAPELVDAVVGAFTAASARGVQVRIAYDAGKPAEQSAETFARLEADPAPVGTDAWVRQHLGGTAAEVKAIEAAPHLMHSKFVVRDAEDPRSAGVWTGSTNFTDDAWTLQENNILRITGRAVAASFRADFDEMWEAGRIAGTGGGAAGSEPLALGTITWRFSPADGAAIEAAMAERVDAARRRVRVAAMVLTSHELLAALARAAGRGVEVTGVYDSGQMDPIVRRWRESSASSAVLADWEAVSPLLSAKRSTPYRPDGPHDFMHLKVLVTDDTVSTGSFNFSAAAKRNAENQAQITDPTIVRLYATFIDDVARTYRARPRS
jgi:phosphatidylserine/phosphatidylglycerophosphate/cardiolipin synthase-like enzyme